METFLNPARLSELWTEIKKRLAGKQDTLTINGGKNISTIQSGNTLTLDLKNVDTTPTSGSTNPVTSGGVLQALGGTVPTTRTINGKPLSSNITLSAADVGASNPNLLDNWYFADPINQQRQTEYVVDGYTIDRWKASCVDVFLVDGAVNIKTRANSSAYKRFAQYIEGEWKAGTHLTLSALVNVHSVSGDVTISPSNYYSYIGGTKSITATGIQLITLSLVTSGDVADGKLAAFEFWAEKNIESAFDIDVMAVKTELGDNQTLAHQDASGNWVLNDPPPNKALELAKCQRYLRPLLNPNHDYSISSTEWGGFSANFHFEFPTMRITPSLLILENNGVRIVYGASGKTKTFTTSEFKLYVPGCDENRVQLGVTWEQEITGDMQNVTVDTHAKNTKLMLTAEL